MEKEILIYFMLVLEVEKMLLHYVMFIKMHMELKLLQKNFLMLNFTLITKKCLRKRVLME